MKTKVYDAKYDDDENPLWRGNPLIEALPKVFPEEFLLKHIKNIPEYDARDRLRPKHERLSYLCRAQELFVPFSHHITLYYRLVRAFRLGYEQRNPMNDLSTNTQFAQVDAFESHMKYPFQAFESESINGFALRGISGVGKSTALSGILRLFPQVVKHTTYQETPLNVHQLVWLKLDCPQDGSLRMVCVNFFQAIDAIFQGKYAQAYAKPGDTTAKMVREVAHVAGLVHLGLLIIDEIQNLNLFYNQGPEPTMAFFTNLSNFIKVPVIFVGTPEAKNVLDGALHQMRRNSGQGELIWDSMSQEDFQDKNGDWNRFVKNLWQYQYTTDHSPLTDELNRALYNASRGVVGFAIKIFVIAQERAISLMEETPHGDALGKEEITKELLEWVAKIDFTKAFERLVIEYPKDIVSKDSAQVKEVTWSKAKPSLPSEAQYPVKRIRRKRNQSVVGSSSYGPVHMGPFELQQMFNAIALAKDENKLAYEVLLNAGFIRDERADLGIPPLAQ